MRTPLTTALGIVCALALAACGQPGDRVEIRESIERSQYSRVPRVNVPSEERFAMAMPRTAAPSAMPAAFGDVPFDYTMPDTWVQVEATQFRNPNFLAGPSGEVECYVSLLPGTSGGLFVNANRWRGQMGQEPYTEAEFQELSRGVVLGQEAVIVDFDGTFSGMGSPDPQPDFRLIGVLVEAAGSGVFIKMVGPDELVIAERDDFARFAQSLTIKGETRGTAASAGPIPESATLPPDHPQIAAAEIPVAAPPPDSSQAAFTWDTPGEWKELDHNSSMRLVTFSLGEGFPGECYVVVLGGDGGGRLNNMNRWLGQMGDVPLEESELDLQPKIMLFEEMVPMLISKGAYSGMGGPPLAGSMLLGATGEIDGQSLFIKLVAPESIAQANWDNFTAFCGSLKLN